ncbi:HAD-IIIA family hydrolase [Microcoleus sp. Pol12A5]|uniref:HAD-IIIA family hydrolase n=1 Tax=Microcoleus sp. Pol12A5 TaxID=3055392 RepID=UPI002FD48236
MTKILFCDVDGTLTGTVSGATFKSNPRDVLVLPGVENALAHYAKEGYLIIGISNEGGVGAGHKKLEAAFEEKQYTCLLLPQLDAIYFCPDFAGQILCRADRDTATEVQVESGKYSSFRKPGAGMIEYCLFLYGSDVGKCWMVGDRPEDEKAAEAMGINFIAADVWRGKFTAV